MVCNAVARDVSGRQMAGSGGLLCGLGVDRETHGFGLADGADLRSCSLQPNQVLRSGVLVAFPGPEHVPGRGKHCMLDCCEGFYWPPPGSVRR